MQTVRLYYENAYLTEFDACVLDCSPADGGFEVVLDRTAFYPEGGGQPCDTGTLNGVPVTDVQEKDGNPVHLVSEPLECGTQVHGAIDFGRRFDLMQQHSGEHMVSGLVHARFGYDNVGFHMGSDVITIDFNGPLTEEDLLSVEQEVNRRIWEDSEVRILYPSEEELGRMPYRSKKELTGAVRIVEFPGTDLCACCGTHVKHTGEIGMVRLLSVVKFREGVRVEMVSGRRVQEYLECVDRQNRRASQLLSAKITETAQAVQHLLDENYRLRGEVIRLQNEVLDREAGDWKDKGNVLLFKEGLEADQVRRLADAVQQVCGGRCAVFSQNPDGSYKYAMGQKDGDLRELTRAMNQALDGRGGGKPFFVQGSVRAAKQQIMDFFAGQEA